MNPAERTRSWPNRNHLIAAVARGNKELIELLLRAGVNPNEVNGRGETILHDLVRLPLGPDAVSMLLPYISELGVRNSKGYTPADIALSEGRDDIARMITEAQGVAHPWWRLPRVSDAARFLSFEPVSAVYSAWISDQLDAEDMWCKVPTESRAMRAARLPFYEDGHILAIENIDRRGPREQFALVRFGRDFVTLDWTNEPFYAVNSQWPLNLTEKTVPVYVRTFFHFVRGHLGHFQIAGDLAEINWLDSATPEQREAVAARLKPLELDGFSAGDRASFSCTVVFKNGLFFSKVLVSFRQQRGIDPDDGNKEMPIGGMRLFEESLLLEDLPIFIQPPASTWG